MLDSLGLVDQTPESLAAVVLQQLCEYFGPKAGLELHFPSFTADRDAAAVRQLKADASRDLTVGGHLAARALNAGLVDECLLFVCPMTVDDGKPAPPADGRLSLEFLGERRFANGVMLLRYRPQPH